MDWKQLKSAASRSRHTGYMEFGAYPVVNTHKAAQCFADAAIIETEAKRLYRIEMKTDDYTEYFRED